jgi:FAD/FMN-containing dehydrogenase
MARLLTVWLLVLLLSTIDATAAGEKSDLIIRSYNHQTVETRDSSRIYHPHTVEEIQAILIEANSEGRKIRAAGENHSTSSVILGDGDYIRTSQLNKIGLIETDGTNTFVTVESGVKLGHLSDYLATKGFSLGFAFPAYRGLSIGGLVATGSHGSSRKHIAVSS